MSTKRGTTTPMTIFAHRGRPPSWWFEGSAAAAAAEFVGEGDSVEEILEDEDERVEEALLDAAVVGPNSPLR
jgi:hypothetical protein